MAEDGPIVEGVALITESPEVHAAQVRAARSIVAVKASGWEDALARVLWPDIWYIQEPREIRVIINGETVTVKQERPNG